VRLSLAHKKPLQVWEPQTGRLLRTVEMASRVSCVVFGLDWRDAELRRAMLLAFAMGLHPRLGRKADVGAGCVVGALDDELLRMVLAGM